MTAPGTTNTPRCADGGEFRGVSRSGAKRHRPRRPDGGESRWVSRSGAKRHRPRRSPSQTVRGPSPPSLGDGDAASRQIWCRLRHQTCHFATSSPPRGPHPEVDAATKVEAVHQSVARRDMSAERWVRGTGRGGSGVGRGTPAVWACRRRPWARPAPVGHPGGHAAAGPPLQANDGFDTGCAASRLGPAQPAGIPLAEARGAPATSLEA